MDPPPCFMPCHGRLILKKKTVTAIETEPEAQISETSVTVEPSAAVQSQRITDDADSGIEVIDGAVTSYDPKSRLDPFVPLFQEKPAQRPDRPRRILTPLEKMTLSQLTLVAVVMGEDLKLAMVEEATGKGYEVEIGTYMGKNGGQVVDIQSDRIIVREMVTNFKGIVTERFEELKLHKADSGD